MILLVFLCTAVALAAPSDARLKTALARYRRMTTVVFSPYWNVPSAIAAAMRSGRERSLALPEPIPVYVTYQTVGLGEDGTVLFWPDVCGHDRAQMPLLPAPTLDPTFPVALTSE